MVSNKIIFSALSETSFRSKMQGKTDGSFSVADKNSFLRP